MGKILALVLGIAALGLVGFYVYNQSMTEDTMMNDDAMMMEDESSDVMMEDEDGMMMDDSMEGEEAMMDGEGMEDEAMMDDGAMMATDSYVVYADGMLDKYADTQRVLFFYANWCPTCQPADADFSANKDQLPDGVTVIRVNYNDDDTDASEQALANQYGVTYQHTYVLLDDKDQAIDRWNGGSVDELLTHI